jgi:hypothetical protein
MGANMYEPDVADVPLTWPTPSLALAAWLVYNGHEIVDVQINDHEQAYWSFTSTGELQEDVMLFSSGNATAEPHEYYGCIQEARKEMFKRKPTSRRTNRQRSA